MDDAKTVWCGNLSDKVTEELLYELFLQAAPLERVRIPTDKEGRKSNYAFITFKHEVSVDYTLQLMNGICLCGKNLNIKRRNTNNQNNQINQNIERNADLRGYIQMLSIDPRLLQHNIPDNRQRRFDRNNFEREDRYRDYKKPDNRNNFDNRHDSPNRRNNYNEHRHNYDRSNRRNHRHY